jgi:hypothetical protein
VLSSGPHAQALVDALDNLLGQAVDALAGIKYDPPIGFPLSRRQIPGSHSFVELTAISIQSIKWFAGFVPPPKSDLYRDIQKYRHVRPERARGELLKLLESSDAQSASCPLIGERRVEIAVAKNDLSKTERGLYDFGHVLRTRGH